MRFLPVGSYQRTDQRVNELTVEDNILLNPGEVLALRTMTQEMLIRGQMTLVSGSQRQDIPFEYVVERKIDVYTQPMGACDDLLALTPAAPPGG